MMNRLSQREKVLAGVVLGVIFLFVNLWVLSSLRRQAGALAGDLAGRKQELASLEEVLREKDQWEQRGEWLVAKQPKLENPSQAGVSLLEQIKQAAQASEVLVESPELGRLEAKAAAQSVAVTVQTKSSWEALVAFLNQLQQPENFIVLESVQLQIDPRDPTQMQGRFRIAKWYAL